MERIVLDTNCLIQIISSKSEFHSVWTKLLSGEIALCVTTDILLEYEEILTQKINARFADIVLSTIVQLVNTHFVINGHRWNYIVSDYDDNKFVDCAINSNAKCIVSDDRHFSILKEIQPPPVDVLRLKEYYIHLQTK